MSKEAKTTVISTGKKNGKTTQQVVIITPSHKSKGKQKYTSKTEHRIVAKDKKVKKEQTVLNAVTSAVTDELLK